MPRGRRRVTGMKVNDLILEHIRQKDAASGLTPAQQEAQSGITRQRLDHLHNRLKVLSVPMLVDWCLSQNCRAGDLLNLAAHFLADSGSIKRARKGQTSLR